MSEAVGCAGFEDVDGVYEEVLFTSVCCDFGEGVA